MDCRGIAESAARVEERNSDKREVQACPTVISSDRERTTLWGRRCVLRQMEQR